MIAKMLELVNLMDHVLVKMNLQELIALWVSLLIIFQRLFLLLVKVTHLKYYKLLKKGAHQNHLGRLASKSSKTKILNKIGI